MVAFVLSGGASHGAIQVGMLRALNEKGIVPDAIYGTSVGAINASAMAQAPDQDPIERLRQSWVNFADDPPIRPSILRQVQAIVAGRSSLSSLDPLRENLEEQFGENRIEDSTIPLHVAATSLLTGRERIFTSGRIVDVILASCSVPGLFDPVTIEGEPFVDGLLYGAPVGAAQENGHTTLYLLLTNSPMPREEAPSKWWEIAKRSATMVMWNQLVTPRLNSVEIHVLPSPPELTRIGRWDFSHTEELISRSYELSSDWLSSKAATVQP